MAATIISITTNHITAWGGSCNSSTTPFLHWKAPSPWFLITKTKAKPASFQPPLKNLSGKDPRLGTKGAPRPPAGHRSLLLADGKSHREDKLLSGRWMPLHAGTPNCQVTAAQREPENPAGRPRSEVGAGGAGGARS